PKSSFEPGLRERLLDRRNILGIVKLPQRKRWRRNVNDRYRDAGGEKPQLLEPFQRLELTDRGCDIALERIGPIGVNPNVQPHGRHFGVERTGWQMRDQALGEIEP